MVLPFLFVTLLAAVPDSDLPRGQLIPHVVCAADAAQSYALYLPSNYTPDRSWPVIYAFDPGGRGQTPVERYRAAAEKYGYIVAGSNNSRNGPWAVSQAAVAAMTGDVLQRFRTDAKREYIAGMSGGSRVALALALGSPDIAGVFASSAGYPDNKVRRELPFPVFETAGTEDFNNLEMREMDRALQTPHHLTIFEGSHTWLPVEVAMEAVEWMEIQAMRSGRKTPDRAELDAIYASRLSRIKPEQVTMDTYTALAAVVSDFTGLEDVSRLSAASAKLTAMGADKHFRATMKDAVKKEREADDRERMMTQEVFQEEALLTDSSRKADALKQLGQLWKTLSEKAKGPTDIPERRMARRVLSGLSMSVSTRDPEYLAIIREYRVARVGQAILSPANSQ